jgi:hypothetical protein
MAATLLRTAARSLSTDGNDPSIHGSTLAVVAVSVSGNVIGAEGVLRPPQLARRARQVMPTSTTKAPRRI